MDQRTPPSSGPATGDVTSNHPLICFSHLRWDFVLQRPQHLMSHFARSQQVFFWEEAAFEEISAPTLRRSPCPRSGVVVLTPVLPHGLDLAAHIEVQQALLDQFAAGQAHSWVKWYYTPMMLPFSRHLPAACTVYDCMDELANFRFAPPQLQTLEAELFQTADVVFTGGFSLYEAKRTRHGNIHPFPSSIDRDHFAPRPNRSDPVDQAAIPHPRFGFYGVIDERMDLDLLRKTAEMRPHWSFVMVGPVVKISEADLPRLPNIHYLGGKRYDELPDYLAGWDVAIMPFAINESTRFISPTKTPEFLSGAKPVVSTPIKDVIRHYGDLDAVQIASTPEEFVTACEAALQLSTMSYWRADVEALLSAQSWTTTAEKMRGHIARHLRLEKARASITPLRPRAARGAARKYDFLIVGAGFSGAVAAERLASQHGKRVLVIDKRGHIGGNAYDFVNDAGVLMHQYGPHIFHTNSADVFSYLSQFTEWRTYEHRVLANLGNIEVPIPINRSTLNMLYGLDLQTEEEAAAFLSSRAEPVANIRTSEDVVVSVVGRNLYERFFRGYTRKQWGLDPSELDKSVTARVPTRTNTDDRYFTDRFQAMPLEGYTKMFARMLDHPNISVRLGVDFAQVRESICFDQLIYTGPIDAYFDHCYGRLPYRSLRFEHKTLPIERYQQVGTVNYPDQDVPYTRITEYKHLTGQKHPQTTITYEYPCADGDPYYPVPREENQALFKRYETLARSERNVHFSGRLGAYRYYNMDQVVGQSLALVRRIAEKEQSRRAAPHSVGLQAIQSERGLGLQASAGSS